MRGRPADNGVGGSVIAGAAATVPCDSSAPDTGLKVPWTLPAAAITAATTPALSVASPTPTARRTLLNS